LLKTKMGKLRVFKREDSEGTGIMKKYLVILTVCLFILPLTCISAEEFREMESNYE